MHTRLPVRPGTIREPDRRQLADLFLYLVETKGQAKGRRLAFLRLDVGEVLEGR